MLENARARFAKSPVAKPYANFVDSTAFGAAADATLLTLLDGLPAPRDAQDAAACFHYLRGAAEAMKLFSSLTDQRTPGPPRVISVNLDHNV